MRTRSTTRWLAGLALTAFLVGGATAAAVAQSDGQYPPGTPSPSKTAVTPGPTKAPAEVRGAQLPITGGNVAAAAGVGALLIGGGVAVRVAARRRKVSPDQPGH